MNREKRINNCETEKYYFCHSERAVATEESISFVIPRRMTLGTPVTSGSEKSVPFRVARGMYRV
ncbi:hypothetical protein KAU32_03970 [bacterium]|nr:hypothetical protein [bacterium]